MTSPSLMLRLQEETGQMKVLFSHNLHYNQTDVVFFFFYSSMFCGHTHSCPEFYVCTWFTTILEKFSSNNIYVLESLG